jgi:hypothetical protein
MEIHRVWDALMLSIGRTDGQYAANRSFARLQNAPETDMVIIKQGGLSSLQTDKIKKGI